MDFYKMAVFLYCAALTHFLADFLGHRKKMGKYIYLHCFIYAVSFIPVFWWLGVNFLWLLLPLFSHLVIDTQGKKLLSLVKTILQEADQKNTTLVMITLGIDQTLHLVALILIAIFTF